MVVGLVNGGVVADLPRALEAAVDGLLGVRAEVFGGELAARGGEDRVRLAASQRVVAVATMSDDVLYAAAAEVIVTIAGCMDGT